MKPYKGTLAVTSVLSALWHCVMRQRSFIVLFTLILTVSAAFGASQNPRPLYLSFEKRLILTYLLAGAGESEETQLRVAQRLENIIRRYMETPAKEIKVRNFSEFLKAYKGPWPDSYSVASDLQLIEAGNFRGALKIHAVNDQGLDNPALQGQVDGFMASQNKQLIERTGIQEAPMALLSPLIESLLKAESTAEKRHWILQGFSTATGLLNQQLELLEKVGDQMAASGKLNNLDPSIKLFLETVLQEYFSRLGLASKKQLVSRFLGQSLTATSMEKFEMMLMGAGPQFQKLLQIISGNSKVSEDLAVVLKKLESKVAPIPAPIVKELFEAERDIYRWVSYKLEPLGTGTMAQVHKGVIRTPHGDEEVVIRFLKPEIETRVHEDGRILNEIAQIMDADPRFRQVGLPKLGPVIQDLNKTVSDELDLQETIQRQKMGRQAYNRSVLVNMDGYKNHLRINVPYVIEGGTGSKLMVQELVEGRKLDGEIATYRDLIPKLGKAVGEQLATVWAEQAFFGTGFFHSDLHQGNYLVNVTDAEIVLSPLDFGMGGVITKEMQQEVVLLGIGVQLDRPELMAQALWSLSMKQINRTTESELKIQVGQRMEKIRKGILKKEALSEWMSWAMDQGVRFPYELVSLNRGMVILDQALKEVGSSLTISDLAEKLAPAKARGLILSLNQKGILTWNDLYKLGLSAIKNSGNSNSVAPAAGKVLQCSKIYVSSGRLSGLSSAFKRALGN